VKANSISGLNSEKKVTFHWARKIWHCLWGLAIAFILIIDPTTQVYLGMVFCLVGFAAYLMEKMRSNFILMNNVMIRLMGFLMRDEEKNGKITGTPYYLLGVGLSLLFFHWPVALLAVLALAFADPISSIIGLRFGKTKISKNRSWEGSLAFFFVIIILQTMLVALDVYPALSCPKWLSIILVAFISTLAEIFSGSQVDDNIVIPLITGVCLEFMWINFQTII
jgi:dolichol kinase